MPREGVKVYNSNPEITIISHVSGDEIIEGAETIFQATVSDGNHAADELRVNWTAGERILCSSIIPEEGGATECVAALEEGDTQVIAQVSDPDGAGGLMSIDVVVIANSAPTASILSPNSDGLYYSDQLIRFAAIIADEEDLASELSYAWSSSLDGDLATTAQPDEDGSMEEYLNLTEGEHALTLSVTDTAGKSASDSINVMVGGPNSDPDCAIVSPQSGEAFIQGETIVFTANATDAENDGDTLTLSWSSDKDGDLGSGLLSSNGDVTLTTSDLSTNTHTIHTAHTNTRHNTV